MVKVSDMSKSFAERRNVCAASCCRHCSYCIGMKDDTFVCIVEPCNPVITFSHDVCDSFDNEIGDAK